MSRLTTPEDRDTVRENYTTFSLVQTDSYRQTGKKEAIKNNVTEGLKTKLITRQIEE